MKKRHGFILLFCLFLLFTANHVRAAEEIEMPVVHKGVNTIYIPAGETVLCQYYKPESLERVQIYTTGNLDTHGSLYNASMEPMISDDDSGDGKNFKIDYDLDAEQLYYIFVKCNDTSYSGNVSLIIEAEHIHRFSPWKTEKDATCTAKGKEYRACHDCSEKEYKDIKMIDHNFYQMERTSETCYKNGKIKNVCNRCGLTQSYVIPAYAHNYSVPELERGYVTPSLPKEREVKKCQYKGCTALQTVNTVTLSMKSAGKNVTSIIPSKAKSLKDEGTTYNISCNKQDVVVIPVVMKDTGTLSMKVSYGHKDDLYVAASLYNNIDWLKKLKTGEAKEPKEIIDNYALSSGKIFKGNTLKKGTYYLVFRNYVSSLSATVKCCYYGMEDNTLKSNSTKLSTGRPWHRIVVPKRGYLELEAHMKDKNAYYLANDSSGLNFVLYDKNKKSTPYKKMEINWRAESSKTKRWIPVEKGTYYLCRSKNGLENEAYSIKYTFKATSPIKNISKSKAQSVKKNQKIVNFIYAKDKKKTWTRYYKIKLTKKQRLYIDVEGGVAVGSFNVYDSKMKWCPTPFKELEGGIDRYYTRKILNKGTYYIVYKTNYSKKYTMGNAFSFSWK